MPACRSTRQGPALGARLSSSRDVQAGGAGHRAAACAVVRGCRPWCAYCMDWEPRQLASAVCCCEVITLRVRCSSRSAPLSTPVAVPVRQRRGETLPVKWGPAQRGCQLLYADALQLRLRWLLGRAQWMLVTANRAPLSCSALSQAGAAPTGGNRSGLSPTRFLAAGACLARRNLN